MIRSFTKHIIGPLAFLIIFGITTGCKQVSKETTDNRAKIVEALGVMKTDAAKLGAASAVADSLYFGTTIMNENFGIVDALTAKYGCTATFFVKKGDAFIRVATDVMKAGKRADGTELDPNGPVIVALKKGEAYYGTVDILGNKFDTGYEPIKNTAGEIVGAYYVGYELKK
jgi:hypothetical protein